MKLVEPDKGSQVDQDHHGSHSIEHVLLALEVIENGLGYHNEHPAEGQPVKFFRHVFCVWILNSVGLFIFWVALILFEHNKVGEKGTEY